MVNKTDEGRGSNGLSFNSWNVFEIVKFFSSGKSIICFYVRAAWLCSKDVYFVSKYDRKVSRNPFFGRAKKKKKSEISIRNHIALDDLSLENARVVPAANRRSPTAEKSSRHDTCGEIRKFPPTPVTRRNVAAAFAQRIKLTWRPAERSKSPNTTPARAQHVRSDRISSKLCAPGRETIVFTVGRLRLRPTRLRLSWR